MPPIDPPPMYWVNGLGDTDGDGDFNVLVAQEIDLFSFGVPTNCACGIGFDAPLPFGVVIEDIRVEAWNKDTGERREISQFLELERKPDADAIYDDLRSGTGETWTGFGGLIPALDDTADLQPGEIYKLVVEIDTPTGFTRGIVLAGGEGTPDGLPVLPGQPHGAEFFSPLNNVPFVPTPGSMVCLCLAGAVAARRRR